MLVSQIKWSLLDCCTENWKTEQCFLQNFSKFYYLPITCRNSVLLICESLMLKVSSCLTSPSRNPSYNFKGEKKKSKNRTKPKHYRVIHCNFLAFNGRIKIKNEVERSIWAAVGGLGLPRLVWFINILSQHHSNMLSKKNNLLKASVGNMQHIQGKHRHIKERSASSPSHTEDEEEAWVWYTALLLLFLQSQREAEFTPAETYPNLHMEIGLYPEQYQES